MQSQSLENVGEDSTMQQWLAGTGDDRLPPPEAHDETRMTALAVPYWAHRKIANVHAYLTNHPGFFSNRTFIALQVRFNPRLTANERWIGGYSSKSGAWLMYDFDARRWMGPVNNQSSWKVRVPNDTSNLFYGMYFCPDAGVESIAASDPLALWVQNHHEENGTLVWEGGTAPNHNNFMGIDRLVGFPFPGGARSYDFPG